MGLLMAHVNIPQVLYLQLENTSHENKNQIMFGYLNMLVELGIFKKVKVGFLLVGNTHDQIYEMFNHFAGTLRRNKFEILPSLIEIIRKLYHLEPVVHKCEEIVHMRRFIFKSHGQERCIEKINDITFQHQFRVKIIYGKKYYAVRSIQHLNQV